MRRQDAYRRRILLKARMLDKVELGRRLGLDLQASYVYRNDIKAGSVEWALLDHFYNHPCATVLPVVSYDEAAGWWNIEPRDARNETTRNPMNNRLHIVLAIIAVRSVDPDGEFNPDCLITPDGQSYYGMGQLRKEVEADLAQIKALGMWVNE